MNRQNHMKNNPQISDIEHQTSVFRTVYIVGPTASGKTATSIKLAQLLGDAEIVAADSQTVRQHLDIGTAKPTVEERGDIVHHGIDIIDIYDDFTLHDYLTYARAAIADIHARGKRAIVVGGTGLYIDALYYDFELPVIERNEQEQRADYESMSVTKLQELIRSRDLGMPENERNKRHLVNTLMRGGLRGTKGEPDPHALIVGLQPPREVLQERIDARVEDMYAHGFLDEVHSIITCFGRPPRSFDAIGYRIALRVVDGEIDVQTAIELQKTADRQYARRQISWFKRNQAIKWFDDSEQAFAYLCSVFAPRV
ncbi:MAG TPA: tRNA (adenosine(37)-N6)-dimethylallyltransferase MiaA [Candidatus Saccharibacteria bacterium]|jgi:tRNA dimethylallyltransferase|nr:tRNA (adenosine(37)-N6)-dimethylallyltransferase MiaA [Candidatus Saccharibacteria bacterium]HMT55984.1 tRNA (adenosine(37)-N6)-dimethylallyltransferase MiaA [Candidatus Saccharibacteria bacterium]